MKALFACGGTGGHIYPAVAVAKGLRQAEPDADILFVGARHGMEKELIPREGFALQTLEVTGLSRNNPKAALRSVWKAGKALFDSLKIIRRFKPDVAVGTGGYASGPIILAAALSRVPVLIHEQNAWPGLTTRLLSPFVTVVAVSHQEAVPRLPRAKKTVVTGLPIRPEFYSIDGSVGKAALELPEDAFLILAVGGSGGAARINQVVCQMAPDILAAEKTVLLQVTGEKYFSEVQKMAALQGWPDSWAKRWQLTPFLADMPKALAAADVVITRAGASTLEEIAAAGVPAVIIPSPNVTDNHQEYNALALAASGGASVILEADLTKESLTEAVNYRIAGGSAALAWSEALKKRSYPEAANELVRIVVSLARPDR